MGEISINNALEHIRSSRVKDRTDGIADLKHILSQNRRSQRLNELNDKGYHALFETLFHVTQSEKTTYAKASKAVRSLASTRLSASASALCLAVEVGLHTMRHKTVKALIDHITQVLPTSDESFCEPILKDYAKALRTLLEYRPHVEHLSKEDWQGLVDFCIEGIQVSLNVEDAQSSVLTVSHSSNRLLGCASRSATPSTLGSSYTHGSSAKGNSSVENIRTLDEFVYCLHYLLSTSNAPVLGKASAVFAIILALLRVPSTAGAHHAAFMCINTALYAVITEDIDLARQTFRDLVPHIRRLWHTKSQALREEMTITVINSEALLFRLMQLDDYEDCKSDLQGLLDAISLEYAKRSERDQLQFDDLDLVLGYSDNDTYAVLRTKAFNLRQGTVKSEQSWAVLDITTSIFATLENSRLSSSVSAGVDDVATPRKRRKVISAVDTLLQPLESASTSDRLISLQSFAFIAGKINFDEESVLRVLEAMIPILSSDVSDLANWAMIALSCTALEINHSVSSHSGLWLQVWQLCARSISSPLTSRASCHLMAVLLNTQLVMYNEVADVVDTMLGSVDLNGPATFTESAATLWAMIIVLKARQNPGTMHDTSERILCWLFIRWKPSQIHERHRITRLSQHCRPPSILRLLSAILGIPCPDGKCPYIRDLGLIAQAALRCRLNKPLITYLLLKDDETATSLQKAQPLSEGTDIQLPDARFQVLYGMALDFLHAEVNALLKDGPFSDAASHQSFSADAASIAGTVCVVTFGLTSTARGRDNGKLRALRTLITKLGNQLANLVPRQENPGEIAEGLLMSLEGVSFATNMHTVQNSMLFEGAVLTALHFNEEFWQGIRLARVEASVNGDAMDFDEEFESQNSSLKGAETKAKDIEHEWLSASTSPSAYRACLIANVCEVSMTRGETADGSPASGTLPNKYIEYLTSLPTDEFLHCRPFFRELFGSGMEIDESGGSMLLEYLGQEILQAYEFQRCEVSLGACLEIMTGLADLWTDDEHPTIADLGASLYEWFIKILNRGICSSHVYQCLSLMLQRVIKVRPDYAKGLQLESARTSLFRILEEGTIAVKFAVGMNISDVFGLFILKEHDAILDDIISSLPSERDWTEGIALRLFVVSHLGSSWSTLLRRCTYAIFETAGEVHSSVTHATYCLRLMSKALNLSNPKELFKLFASQIIFTWLESQTLKMIPFSIFGYPTLTALLQDVQDEVTGQVVMRGRNGEAQQLADMLLVPFDTLLELSFGKCAAYCIARDATVPPTRDVQASGADVRLRKLVGKERYGALISERFPEILAALYRTTDREENIVKGFQKLEIYSAAYEAYNEMMSYSASTATLPVSQQPSFKAGYLVDEIAYLFSKSTYDPEASWTPALYVFVFRELLNSIHQALGSLHACSVIRRIRILISMAGETPLHDYPLEVTLHSLRLFLTDTHCAEDTIGICHYLLSHGVTYLQQVPSFLAGFTVSTLASMKKFLNSPQESTTQESQFVATMSRAQSFHIWLGEFADSYYSPQLDEVTERSFKAVVVSARQLRNVGNARKGTYEGDLLFELLKDRLAGSILVDKASQNLILDLLCSSFEVPVSFRDDILGSEEQAAEYVSAIWDTCQDRACSPEYLLWVARVLGRAYGGTGTVEEAMSREVSVDASSTLNSPSQQHLDASSRHSLLNLLWSTLLTDSRQDVSLAEKTLQKVVTKAEGTDLWNECEHLFPPSLMCALTWSPFPCPKIPSVQGKAETLQEAAAVDEGLTFPLWIRRLCVALVDMAPNDILLSELKPILSAVDSLPEKMFPSILHLVLLREIDKQQVTKQVFSAAIGQLFKDFTDEKAPHTRLVLRSIIYLRTQALPHEHTKAERSNWLDFDYEHAADVAVLCRMFKTALLFLEIGCSEASKIKRSRRSSGLKVDVPIELLLKIYRNIEDKDSFYGIRQPSSLPTMMGQLEYENAGFKSLSFRGAHFDSQIRHLKEPIVSSEEEMVSVLDTLDLNGLSQAVLSGMTSAGPASTEAMLRTARKLERWDVSSVGAHTGTASTIFRAFQEIHRASDYKTVSNALDRGFSATIKSLLATKPTDASLHSALGCLAVLTEIEDVVSSQRTEQLQEAWERLERRNEWMLSESFDHVSTIVSCRQTLFSTVTKSGNLQHLLRTSQRDARRVECRALVASTRLSRHHGALQNALSAATYLDQIAKPCLEEGVNIDAIARLEGSDVLWDQEEMSASIRMLQDIVQGVDLRSQEMKVGKPELLAKLGHRISEARLEKPDEIITNYLRPAIKELGGVSDGKEAGQVFHEFAAFCDQQLQNPDNLEDFRRIQTLRERKQAEVRDLEQMIKSASSQSRSKDNLESHKKKAQSWFNLDDREYQRLKESREAFLSQSLENYLLGLRACDDYDGDALRFSALWLEHSDSKTANAAVSKHLGQVGSGKFASLMNQWTSRLLDVSNDFQTLLSALVFRICLEHPYHGMYQVFASSKTKGGKDQTALARNAAAMNIVTKVKSNRRTGPIWISVHNSNINFVRFAQEKLDESKYKPGSKVPLRKSPSGVKLEQDLSTHQIPPPTMKIELRADCDYSRIPLIVRYHTEFSIASGISMPKILTAVASNGRKYKQLFKAGNDDLRQDSIMEQAFEQVGSLLKSHRDTRQRNLGIRTYKVLPLTSTSGIIEFVSDTIPLHDYLMPAHQRHYPSDLKPNVCRKHILDVQNKPVDVRVKTFLSVCDRFHPVLRYFFMERFESPDEWFEKRLAYTRSTAAISILGYILGLGDRHGHNILLDEKTGEVIHIDLGIAFEQGRVLPVPEVVPFRLTRDLVDAMGITKTEGVFRRCCEFTLEALRNESYSIMTILDVLRYDPLYSWSVSPLRLKRMQDNETDLAAAATAKPVDEDLGRDKRENEPGEADRALTVVKKKLSKSLSVTATVNELIQQATDERNLALLFCGWAAYA
ncbi:Serine/threonine-protein kinase tel1 [Trapelia coarctata]|nr:Serine/threonine-protein kinase tel1 [Trapelia coarctata]